MNGVQVFSNEEFGRVRALEIGGEPWFVGKDVAERLGYANTRDALNKHVDDEDKDTVAFHDGTSGNPNQTIINESGLYSLILSSKLPSAKRFKRWVTAEVLPALRKEGRYGTGERPEAPSPEELRMEAAGIISGCPADRLRYVLHILKPLFPGMGEPDRAAAPGRNLRMAPMAAEMPVRPGGSNQELAAEYIDLAFDRGMTYRGLAERAGLHTMQIWRIRTGRSEPSTEKTEAIIGAVAEAFPDIEI